jgi:hypothetical protein
LFPNEYTEKGRQQGHLELLWNRTSPKDISTDHPLMMARTHLLLTRTFVDPASSHLSINILRTRPKYRKWHIHHRRDYSIIHLSIGSSTRKAVLEGFGPEGPEIDLRAIF